jgi:hypothetical protein
VNKRGEALALFALRKRPAAALERSDHIGFVVYLLESKTGGPSLFGKCASAAHQ